MRKSALLLSIFLIFGFKAFCQFVQIGDGTFLAQAGGPFYTSTTSASFGSRFAYIFPKSVLGNLKHGDTISSIEFSREAGANLNNSCNLKIYIKNTNLYDFGSGTLRWSAEISGLTAAYDQNPTGYIGNSEGFQRIPLNNKKFVFDTTAGINLEILIQFTQTSAQSAVVNWYFENSASVTGYATNQTKSMNGINLSDSLSTSSDYHPTIILNYPRYDRDVALIKLYSLGKLPVPLGNPDSVKILVRNVGKKDASNVKVKTWLQGFNSGIDSTAFNIATFQQKFVNIPSLNPKNKGLDTLHAQIFGDSNTSNNHAETYRLNNENTYSYRDVTQPPAGGGIGFNGQTGDFVARFYSNKVKSINQVAVRFFLSGRPFKIGIWDNSGNGGRPGTLIYLSDSLMTVSGNYILDLKKPVGVNGTFFVGVRQLNTNNVAFGYQIESPVRPNTFYYTVPAGGTTWYDFHPDAPFKFLIEPRLQGDTDLTVVSADFPRDSIDRHTTDTLAPKATIANIGAKDLLDSFDITCEINFYGKTVYKKVIRDTMSSGVKRSYTFPKTFYPLDFGEHEILVYTSYPKDQIIDNDTGRRKFYVGVKKDVMVSTVYEPSNNIILEYLKDTILPVATVQNPGYDNTIFFLARCRILKGNTTVYNQTQSLSLPRFNSKILIWPVYKCTDTGKLKVIFTVEMAGDVYRKNDTIVRNITVFKSYDVLPDSIALPDKNKYYTPKTTYKPIVRIFNDGVLEASNTTVICTITSPYSSLIYRDTIVASIPGKDKLLVQFKRNFTPDKKGLYTIFIRALHSGDIVNFNDSFQQNFHVGYPFDYHTQNIYFPVKTDTLSSGGGPFTPRIKMGNNGYVKNTDVVPVVFQVWRKGIRVYQDIKSLNLDTGKSFDLNFSSNLNPINGGEHQVIAYTSYVSDVNKKNDTFYSKFFVTIGRDAFVESIDSQVTEKKYEARRDSVSVSVTIANDGKLKMDNVRTYAEIYFAGSLVYFDKIDEALNGLEQKPILFNRKFHPQEPGKYRLLVYTYSDQDQNIYNDTSEAFFDAIKSNDLAITAWMEPATGSIIVHNSGSKVPEILIEQLGGDSNLTSNGMVYFTIMNSGFVNVYHDSGIFSGLVNKQALRVKADSSWGFNLPGFYTAIAVVKNQDLFSENDTLFTAFEIRLNGVVKINENRISLSPNPAQNTVKIRTDREIDALFACDALGRKVNLPGISINEFDVQHLVAGVYTVVVYSNNHIHKIRFIKE